MGFAPTPEQAAIRDAARIEQDLIIEAGAGTGKALRADQPVVTPLGYRPIGELTVGDQVLGRDGLTYVVDGVYPQGVRSLFAVIFSDGTQVIADAGHRWAVQHHRQRDRGCSDHIVLTTAELIERGATRTGGGGRWFLPMTEPLKLPEVDLPLDPWLLGVLLGDGQLTPTISVTNPEPEIIERVRILVEPLGIDMRQAPSDPITYSLGGRQVLPGRRGFWNPIVDALKGLGLCGLLSHEKFVPDAYRCASVDQRLELLRGLFDTDGSRAAAGAVDYSTASPRLARDVMWLVNSLGGTATYVVKPTTHKPAHRLYVKLPADVAPFFLPRKADGWTGGTRIRPCRAIRSITPVEPDEAVCIRVTSPDHLFLTAGCAPTHNTSTLRLLGNDQSNDRCLYIAYNKAIQVEADASFPANVRCRTAHSLAYGGTIGRYGTRVSKARMGGIQSSELLTALRIGKSYDIGADKPLEPKTIAEMTARTLTRYLTTGDREITGFHAPHVPGLEDETSAELRSYLAELANTAWRDYAAPKGKLTFTPNIYLKLWQLGNPTLRFDTIFFDEAQDANGAMMSVVNRQKCQRRAVGDRNQALYEWNGAVDAMAKWDWTRLMLTQSFRFGQEIAEQANKWLDYLDADLRLSGLESINSQVCDEIELPDAVLCRTNMGVIDAALSWLARGRSVAVVGGIGEAARLARAAADLRSGRGTDHPDLAAFTDWDAFTYFVKTDPDGEDFKVLVGLIETYGTDAILSLQRNLRAKEADADVVISTGHKAKGREWDSVEIGADFAPRESDSEDDTPLFTRPQAMLAYVAVTRARLAVCLGPLAGVL